MARHWAGYAVLTYRVVFCWTMKLGIPSISLSAASLAESMILSSGPVRGGGAGRAAVFGGSGGAGGGAVGGAAATEGLGGAAGESESGARCRVGRESSSAGGFTDAVVVSSFSFPLELLEEAPVEEAPLDPRAGSTSIVPAECVSDATGVLAE